MDSIRLFFLFMTLLALLCLLIGLLKPWVMLWWEDVQNRKKVIKLYGTAVVVSYALYWASNLL